MFVIMDNNSKNPGESIKYEEKNEIQLSDTTDKEDQKS